MLLKVWNYRPFAQESPLSIEIHDGITALIGVNNSGKSFVLKFFYEMRNLFHNLAYSHVRLDQTLSFNLNTRSHFKEVFNNTSNLPIVIQLSQGELELRAQIERGSSQANLEVTFKKEKLPRDVRILAGKLLSPADSVIADFSQFTGVCKDIVSSRYYPAFRNAVNVGSQDQYFDLATGEAFIRNWQAVLAGKDPDVRNATNEVMKDLRELFGYKEFNIVADSNSREMFVNIDGRSYSLEDLGAGITQFILVFANIALHNPSFILIDEPEINLHPKLQLDFMNRILSYVLLPV